MRVQVLPRFYLPLQSFLSRNVTLLLFSFVPQRLSGRSRNRVHAFLILLLRLLFSCYRCQRYLLNASRRSCVSLNCSCVIICVFIFNIYQEYIASISSLYNLLIMARRTFSVLVSSPVSILKALGKRVNFLICCHEAKSF